MVNGIQSNMFDPFVKLTPEIINKPQIGNSMAAMPVNSGIDQVVISQPEQAQKDGFLKSSLKIAGVAFAAAAALLAVKKSTNLLIPNEGQELGLIRKPLNAAAEWLDGNVYQKIAGWFNKTVEEGKSFMNKTEQASSEQAKETVGKFQYDVSAEALSASSKEAPQFYQDFTKWFKDALEKGKKSANEVEQNIQQATSGKKPEEML